MSHHRTNGLLALLLAAMTAGLTGCRRDEADAMVFASASLAHVFDELAAEFERANPGPPVRVHAAGTPTLLLQLREGATADVFASADDVQMRRAVDAGHSAREPVAFAGNRLVIVTQRESQHGIATLADLSAAGIVVVLCGPAVPAGRYARRMLDAAGIELRSASDEPSVRAVLAKVRLGEADAGIVYATDVVDDDGLRTIAIEPPHDTGTTCWIAPLAVGKHGARGRAFVEFVLSAAGRDLLRSRGFTTP